MQTATTLPADDGKNPAAEIFDDTIAAAYADGIKARAVRDWRTKRGLRGRRAKRGLPRSRVSLPPQAKARRIAPATLQPLSKRKCRQFHIALFSGVPQLLTVGNNDMKTAVTFLIIGLILGLVVPHYLREIYSGAGIELPQFFWSKTPRSFNINIPVVLRVIGAIFVALAIIRFILVHDNHTN